MAESFLVIQYSRSSSAGQISSYSDASNKNPEDVLLQFCRETHQDNIHVIANGLIKEV